MSFLVINSAVWVTMTMAQGEIDIDAQPFLISEEESKERARRTVFRRAAFWVFTVEGILMVAL
jgi:hypothetical protein